MSYYHDAIAPRMPTHLPAASVRRWMRAYGVTIRELAARMDVTLRRIRQGRLEGLSGREVVRDWIKAISGEDPALTLAHGWKAEAA